MERLTPPERAVFVLREAFELPYEQIAEIVGCSLANAASCTTAPRRAWRGAATASSHRDPRRPHP
jgi:RNA polymerase sigma-70 factor (ECF subfamily)